MSYRMKYATAGLGQAMYATAGMGRMQYATAGLGLAPGNILKNTRGVQEFLIQKGFSVGRTGADGVWGRNSRAAYDRALGTGSSSRVSESGSNLELPAEHWDRLNSMPNRPVTSGGTSPAPSTPSAPATTIGPHLDPEAEEGLVNGGTDWMSYWPYALGGVAVLGLSGFLIMKGRKARAMKANRRRRRRRSSKRRRSSRRRR